jgi:hypothetical protein
LTVEHMKLPNEFDDALTGKLWRYTSPSVFYLVDEYWPSNNPLALAL